MPETSCWKRPSVGEHDRIKNMRIIHLSEVTRSDILLPISRCETFSGHSINEPQEPKPYTH